VTETRRVFVSVGSNIEPRRHVAVALDLLERRCGPLARSRAYRTEAVGFDGAPFLNLVVGFDSNAGVELVQEQLRLVEDACGRTRGGPRFGPRTLDADLLLYGDEVRADGDGIPGLPRGEVYTEPYVLGPLVELAPELRDPRSGRRFSELWAEMDAASALHPVGLALPDPER